MERKRLREYNDNSQGEFAPKANQMNASNCNSETQPPSEYQFTGTQAQDEDLVNEVYDDVEIKDEHGNVRKKRGIRAKDVWTLPNNERIIVHFNELGQPIKKGGGILGGWLGTVARKKEFCSIEWTDWRKMPNNNKENLIILTKKYFAIPDDVEAQKWVLQSIGRKWKDFKFDLKCKHFFPDKSQEEIFNSVPIGVFPNQWRTLVKYWFSEKAKNLSEKGKAARAHNKTIHTNGSKSFARGWNEYEMTHGKKPGRIEFFRMTHMRKDGNFINEQIQEVVEKANEIVAERVALTVNRNANEVEDEVFSEVLGEDQYGRVRGYGLGVTPTQLFGTKSQFKCKNHTEVESLQKELYDMNQSYEAKIESMQQEHDVMKNDYEKQIAVLRKELDFIRSDLSHFKILFSEAAHNFSETDYTQE